MLFKSGSYTLDAADSRAPCCDGLRPMTSTLPEVGLDNLVATSRAPCCTAQAALQQSAEAAAGVRAMDLAAAERLKREVAALRHETQTLAAQLQVARVHYPPHHRTATLFLQVTTSLPATSEGFVEWSRLAGQLVVCSVSFQPRVRLHQLQPPLLPTSTVHRRALAHLRCMQQDLLAV